MCIVAVSAACDGGESADPDGSVATSAPDQDKKYVVTPDGEIVLLEGATEEDIAAAEAEQERILGDQMPRVVDDTELVLDESAGTVRLGGLLLEHPVFNTVVSQNDEIDRSTSLPRDLPVLHFLQMRAKDVEATDAYNEANGTEKSLAVTVGMGVLEQTTMVTLEDNRIAVIEALQVIGGTFEDEDPELVYSGSVGDFREGIQCWVDIMSAGPERGDHVTFVVSFAGPDIASSTMVVSTARQIPSAPINFEFVRSMVTQACGALPEGFENLDLG